MSHFTKGTRIKEWGQWSEEEDEGRGEWEDVSAAIDFPRGIMEPWEVDAL